jgi:hypothetical protein
MRPGDSWQPYAPPEVTAAEKRAARCCEDQSVRLGRDEVGQVTGQRGSDQLREHYEPGTGVRLWRAEHEAAALQLRQCALYTNGSGGQVDVCPAQGAEFAPSEAGECAQEDERSVPGRDRLRESHYLDHSQHGPFAGLLLPGTLDTARVAPEQAIFDCGGEDRLQQAVCLGCGDRARAPVEQLRSPSPDLRVLDCSDGLRAECRGETGIKFAIRPTRKANGVRVYPGESAERRASPSRRSRT